VKDHKKELILMEENAVKDLEEAAYALKISKKIIEKNNQKLKAQLASSEVTVLKTRAQLDTQRDLELGLREELKALSTFQLTIMNMGIDTDEIVNPNPNPNPNPTPNPTPSSNPNGVDRENKDDKSDKVNDILSGNDRGTDVDITSPYKINKLSKVEGDGFMGEREKLSTLLRASQNISIELAGENERLIVDKERLVLVLGLGLGLGLENVRLIVDYERLVLGLVLGLGLRLEH
jgi:hypothetical protein